MRDEIIAAMARAFFASAWADQAEDCDVSVRGEIMDQLPNVTDASAVHAAHCLEHDMTRANQGQTLKALYHAHSGGLTSRDWGHYAAMSAMGHGVGLWEYTEAVKVPHVEFGSYSLQQDYFTATLEA